MKKSFISNIIYFEQANKSKAVLMRYKIGKLINKDMNYTQKGSTGGVQKQKTV